MRIWDIKTKYLCKDHLLGEHRELHAVWNILTLDKKGYRHHPETKRWEGKLGALYHRHEEQVAEIQNRGWQHHSDLDRSLATGDPAQKCFVDPIMVQKRELKAKNCACITK